MAARMADAALRHERASSVVAFVAAGGESSEGLIGMLIGRFHTALSQPEGEWSLVVGHGDGLAATRQPNVATARRRNGQRDLPQGREGG